MFKVGATGPDTRVLSARTEARARESGLSVGLRPARLGFDVSINSFWRADQQGGLVAFSARRSIKLAAALLATVALIGCTSKDADESGNGDDAPSDADLSAVLGEPNPATGDPIKIGFVHDGQTEGLDHGPVVTAMRATVDYVNEYRGGINGHEIDLVECSTDNTPAGGTQCGVQMINDEVAAVVVPTSAQDGAIFSAVQEAGIPFIAYASANQDIILNPGGFVISNPTGTIAAPIALARAEGITKNASVVIDVPAATGPISMLADPLFAAAGQEYEMIPISPQTADMTPQIQEALSSGAGFFAMVGTDEFNAGVIKALKQLGFEGPMMIGSGVPAVGALDSVPGGVEGVIVTSSVTSDPDDPDVQIYDAAMEKYAKGEEINTTSAWAFVSMVALVNALEQAPAATDAASVLEALSSMAEPAPVPMGAGLEFQCGAGVVSFAPNVCSANLLEARLDEDGAAVDFKVLDVSEYLSLG